MKKYVCMICGYVYDEALGIPEKGIAAGTKWEDLPENWVCPLCGAAKADFKEQEEAKPAAVEPFEMTEEDVVSELSFAQMSALCSNFAKGCEKQYLERESELFLKLAGYYKAKAGTVCDQSMEVLLEKVNRNLEEDYPNANAAANAVGDRGALRALVWSEKVTRMLNSFMSRYSEEKDGLLENTNVYVCEICGFVYIGDVPPAICPVCKVPNRKMTKVERG